LKYLAEPDLCFGSIQAAFLILGIFVKPVKEFGGVTQR
jgi:hypothetical protein